MQQANLPPSLLQAPLLRCVGDGQWWVAVFARSKVERCENGFGDLDREDKGRDRIWSATQGRKESRAFVCEVMAKSHKSGIEMTCWVQVIAYLSKYVSLTH